MRRPLLLVAVFAAAALVAFLLWPSPVPATGTGPVTPAAPRTPAPSPPLPAGPAPAATAGPTPLDILDLARDLNAPAGTVAADLRLVSSVLETFRTNFPREGNPVGTNAEITAILTGANRLRLAFLHPRHPALNAAGELCDRWGTPFFFHAESATRMEIRSAGPDRKMWTADDETFVP